MGRMKLEIKMHDGKVDVRLRIENPQVRQVLKAELANLDRAFKEMQVDVGRLEVSDYQSGRGDQWPTSGEPGGEDTSTAASQPDATDAEGWAVISRSGRVDCLI